MDISSTFEGVGILALSAVAIAVVIWLIGQAARLFVAAIKKLAVALMWVAAIASSVGGLVALAFSEGELFWLAGAAGVTVFWLGLAVLASLGPRPRRAPADGEDDESRRQREMFDLRHRYHDAGIDPE